MCFQRGYLNLLPGRTAHLTSTKPTAFPNSLHLLHWPFHKPRWTEARNLKTIKEVQEESNIIILTLQKSLSSWEKILLSCYRLDFRTSSCVQKEKSAFALPVLRDESFLGWVQPRAVTCRTRCPGMGGGDGFKDFGHFHKIASGCMLPKVGKQVLVLDTPRFHHSSTAWWLVTFQNVSFFLDSNVFLTSECSCKP